MYFSTKSLACCSHKSIYKYAIRASMKSDNTESLFLPSEFNSPSHKNIYSQAFISLATSARIFSFTNAILYKLIISSHIGIFSLYNLSAIINHNIASHKNSSLSLDSITL
jgi:hypothetical protein